jgi:outer membrane protein assembly factor BamB
MISALFVALFLQQLIVNDALAQWTHWRGETRDGKSTEVSGWDGTEWQLSEPAWQAQIGEGSAAPLVIDDHVITLGWKGSGELGKDVLACLDLATGKQLWEQTYQAPLFGRESVGDQGLYSGPSATPEFDRDSGLLYTMSTDGDVRCWNYRDQGALVWEKNLYEEYKIERRPDVGRGTRRDYGYTTAPVVFGDWLLVEVGSATAGNLIAFDKSTGKVVWGSENKDLAGHSGAPVLMTVDKIPCVAVLTLRNLVVTRLDKANAGKTVGVYSWTTDFANNIPTPAVYENSVIISTAYNHYATCRVDFSLSDGAKQIWETKKICTGVCSPVIDQGNIYWAWRGIHCLDFATGKLKWKGGKTNEAGSCVLTADGRLIVWATRGDLLLVNSSQHADEYTQLDSRELLAKTDAWPHIVLANGCILCRDRAGTLICLRIGG